MEFFNHNNIAKVSRIIFLENEVAIRTAPVSEHSFAIRTAMLMHMRSEAMINLFVRRWF